METDNDTREEVTGVERHLRARLQRQRERFQAVLDVSRAISTILDLDELLQRTVEVARERFDLYYAGLFLLDESGEWAVLRAGTGEAGRQMLVQGHRLRVDEESMIGWCILHRRPRIVSEVSREKVHFKNPLLPLTRSEMALPLLVRDEVVGALTIQSEKPDAFSEDDVSILRGMADQIGAAIVNARLFAQVRTSREQAESLFNIGQALSAAHDSNEVLRAVIRPAIQNGAYRAHLLFVEEGATPDATWIRVTGSWLRDEQAVALDGSRFRVGEFPLSNALTDFSRPLFIPDVAADERVSDEVKKMAARLGVRAVVAIPLLLAGELIGLLAIAWDRPHHFDRWEEEFYTAIINLATPVLGNIRLLRRVQESLNDTQVLYEVGRQLSTTLDEREIMERTLVQAARVGAGRMMFGMYEGPPDGEAEWLNVKAIYEPGKERQPVAGKRLSLDSIPTVRYAYEHALEGPLVLEHLRGTPPEDEALRATFAETGVQAFASIPVIWQGKVFAALAVERYDRDYFTAAELALLQGIADQAAIALQSAHLFGEQQEARSLLGGRVRELDCLNDIGRKIEEQPPIPEFLEWVAARMPTALQHAAECVTAIEFEGQVYGDERAITSPYQMVQGIRIGGETVGKIYIAYTTKHSFTDEESALLGDITRRVSGYVESRRLLERIREALKETQTLYQATADLGAAQTYDDVLETLRKHTLIGEADLNVSLNLFSEPWVGDRVPEWSIVMARWTRLPPEATSPRYPLRAFPSAPRLLRPNRPTLVENVHTFPDMDDRARALYAQRYGAGSTIFVPLTVRGRWIGYVNAIYSEPTRFPEDEVRLLMALSGQAAIVVQNLRQLAEIRTRARREQAVRRVITGVRRFTDPDAIARAAVRELGEVLGRPVFLRVGNLEPPAQKE